MLIDISNYCYCGSTKGFQKDWNHTILVYTRLNTKKHEKNIICSVSVTILLENNCTSVDPENSAQNNLSVFQRIILPFYCQSMQFTVCFLSQAVTQQCGFALSLKMTWHQAWVLQMPESLEKPIFFLFKLPQQSILWTAKKSPGENTLF